MQVFAQRCQNAFDTIQHDKLLHVLSESGLDGRDVRIIANLY